MKLIKPKFEIIEQAPGIEGAYKQVEIAGRTCYHSQDRITADSAKTFVDRMIKSKHGSMLEHGTVYLAMPMETILPIIANGWGKYYKNKYSKAGKVCEISNNQKVAVTTNLRVLVENNWLDDFKYICEPTEFHEERVTVRFNTDIGISREFNRHRVNSPAEQSTRYCNYTKDKFDNEITYVIPSKLASVDIDECKHQWGDEDETDMGIFRLMCRWISSYNDLNEIDTWIFGCLSAEYCYKNLIKLGWTPQEARGKLELDTATELVHTAYVSDWQHFFDLRCDTAAHPDARALALPLKEEFIKRGYIQ